MKSHASSRGIDSVGRENEDIERVAGKLNVVVRFEGTGGDEGGKGVIVGVLFGVLMKELVENLKMQNRYRSAEKMTRGVEQMETETVLVEFKTK